MYRWFWRRLPGGKLVKALIATLAVIALTAVLFMWGFPALDIYFGQSPIVQG
ncbi:MAG: hypothetical protein RL402_618 [Actinomycetota bacterium]|jgi:hypothetical protein|nr:hypothetical protein [Actinomycetota bacterium]